MAIELQAGWICSWDTPRGKCEVRIVETGKEHWGNQSLVVDDQERMGVATNMDLTVIEKKDPPAQAFRKVVAPARKNLLAGLQGEGDENIRRYTHV